ncbi:glycogen debranching enzyme [Methylosinus sp. sav-2]|uniref:amylo-alpha-1,6-glucosidase n=1 Tax=Methylosinus sp. sav-2 TaxID=2485168 RepID=UPI000562BBA5|nr:amylo-alpha-1,6-glucosidase [Methylosinus sp. sav-2]TDX64856.1 glycogen debranching enzyme [Methylosinus sp. sav-2]
MSRNKSNRTTHIPRASESAPARHAQDSGAPPDAGADAPQAHELQFYIPATGPPSRPRRTLKHDDTFAVFDSHGDIGATAGGPDGLFDHDTRYLSHLELLIEGAQPLLLDSAIRDDNLSFYVDLTNPDIFRDEKIALLKDSVYVSRTLYLKDGSLRERLEVSNQSAEEVRLNLSIGFGNDFADIFEVRGVRRAQRGRAWAQLLAAGAVALYYRGLDGVLRETALSFEPDPSLLVDSVATYSLRLAPRQAQTIFLTAASRGRLPKSTQSFFNGLTGLHRELKAAAGQSAHVETADPTLNQILWRSTADVRMLLTKTADGSYPYAGIPWYSTTFGRDGIITALQMLWFDPSIAIGVLKRLAAHQAEDFDARADSEPGKILHEMRDGEMAALGEVPFGLYYGSVDSTPLFVILAGYYARRTGDYALVRELWPAIERALAWIDGPGDPDGDGFVEYARHTEQGLRNQGWKDSHDSVFHADGRLADGPIALVEAQAYVYAARRLAAHCARELGLHARAEELARAAEALRVRFEEAFWCEEIGSYALALDGEKKQCKVRTSNAGHALYAGIAQPDRAQRVADGLLDSRFFSGWGLRTVARGESRYNPMSYHNGSIWPHDNALIAHGLGRYGFKEGVAAIFESLTRAASYMEARRIPELYCGFRRRHGRGPTLYPAACSPQAWAASAPFLFIQTMLGLEFDHKARQIRLVNPSVPLSAGEIVIRNLSLGEARVDLALKQDARSAISLHVLRTIGDVQVSLVFDPDVREHPLTTKG